MRTMEERAGWLCVHHAHTGRFDPQCGSCCQIADALRVVRAEALEEAAKVADDITDEYDLPDGVSAAGVRKAKRIASSIRALASRETG